MSIKEILSEANPTPQNVVQLSYGPVIDVSLIAYLSEYNEAEETFTVLMTYTGNIDFQASIEDYLLIKNTLLQRNSNGFYGS